MQTEIDLFLLAPSTRITILESEEKKSREENNIDLRSPNLSDASEILLGTIRAINEGENANIPRVFLLSGPAGVGKTHAVRTAVQCSRARIYSKFLRGSDIMASAGVSSTPGLSLEKHFMHLQRQSVDRICIVFLDECDALMSSHTATAMLGYQLDQVALRWKRIIVVAATNKIDSVPLLLRRAGRFEHALILQPPSLAQRHMILKSLVGEETPHVEEIAEMTIGFVPADLHALARKARVLSLSNTHSLATNLRKAMVDVGASVSHWFLFKPVLMLSNSHNKLLSQPIAAGPSRRIAVQTPQSYMGQYCWRRRWSKGMFEQSLVSTRWVVDQHP